MNKKTTMTKGMMWLEAKMHVKKVFESKEGTTYDNYAPK